MPRAQNAPAPSSKTPHGAALTIHTILAQFREEASSNRDLGDRFERLICRYLELNPIYVERPSRVWMWNEFPRKGNIGDVGIDIVAEERAKGESCAIRRALVEAVLVDCIVALPG